MRIRSTKPEFWKSRRIAAVDWDARLVLKALESYVDDNGVGKDDLELIVTELFSRDLVREGSRILARVSEAISRLHEAGLVWRYRDESTDLLYISFWESIQRVDKPQPGRFRRPDGTLAYKESIIRESSRTFANDSGALAPGTGEQGNRGTGEQTLSITADAATEIDHAERDFEDFWEHYPRKVGKGQARKAWKAAAKKADPDEIIRAAEDFAAANTHTEPRFIAHPATWLNGERWDDVEATPATKRGADEPFTPFSPPPCPPDIADDPARYAAWMDEQRAAWRASR